MLFLSSKHDLLNFGEVLLEVFLSKLLYGDLFAFELLLANTSFDFIPVLVLNGLARDQFDHWQFLTESLKLAFHVKCHIGYFLIIYVKLLVKTLKRDDVVVHSRIHFFIRGCRHQWGRCPILQTLKDIKSQLNKITERLKGYVEFF